MIIHLLITSVLILLVANHIKGIEVDGWMAALIAAVVLGVINAILYPVAVFLTLPFTILTLGLFLLVVHAAMFKLCAALVPGFRIVGFVPAIYGSILLTLLDLLISLFL